MTRNDVEYLDLGELVVLLTQNMICVFSFLAKETNKFDSALMYVMANFRLCLRLGRIAL